jgi:hypothetical protein
MKTSKFTFAFSTFLLGAGFGIAVLALISFSAANPSLPSIRTGQITVDSAVHMASNYIANAEVITAKPEAVVVDTTQVRVMYNLMLRDKSLAGFRIYFGYPTKISREKVGIVVGMDAKEHDLIQYIYQTAGTHIGPCPTICDISSPIHRQ